MKFYVTEDAKNIGELIAIDIDDVIFIESGERTVVIHTKDGAYYPLMPTLSTFEHQMKSFNFKRLDRTNLVNTEKITEFDESRSVVYFEKPVTEKSKFGTVSSSARRMLKKLLQNKKK